MDDSERAIRALDGTLERPRNGTHFPGCLGRFLFAKRPPAGGWGEFC